MTLNNAPIWKMAILDKSLFLLSYGFIIAGFNSWHDACIVFITGSSASNSKHQLFTRGKK
jgi:hypothetical protein